MNKIKSNQGSFTIEAVIVFTVMFFVLLVLIFMGLFLYQQVRLQTLAQKSASRGAMIYNIDSKQGARVARIQEYINKQVLAKNLVSQVSNTRKSISAIAEVENYLIVKKTIVNINSEYIVPIGGIFRLFGIPSPFKLTAHSEAMIQEPAEFIRNIDICGDILKYADKQVPGGKAGESFNTLVSKMTGLIRKLSP